MHFSKNLELNSIATITDSDKFHNSPLEITQNNSSSIKTQWNQVFAAVAATMSAAGLGCVMAYTATALPDLRLHEPFGPVISSQETWIGPLALLGGSVACPVAGFLVDAVGRRKTIVVMMPLFVSGWVLIALAQNMGMIFLGRFITGFCGGSINLAIPVFIAEMSDARIRGTLTSGLDLMITVGILYAYLMGTCVNWQLTALACAAVPLLCFLLMLFVPESPQYLLQRNRVDEAKKAFKWFRKANPDVESDFCELSASVSFSLKEAAGWSDMLKPAMLKPISIGIVLMLVQQGSGILPIIAYTVDIFHSAGTHINENLSTNIVGVIQVVATVTSALLVDRCGRRWLLMVSQSFMVISMGGMGTFFYFKNSKNASFPLDDLSWLPLTSLLVFVVAFSLGIGPISWVYMGEILPSQVKGKGSGLITFTSWFLSFGMTLGFGTLLEGVGEAAGYWLFGGASLLGLIYIYFCVPETKGKTLDEIQSHFN